MDEYEAWKQLLADKNIVPLCKGGFNSGDGRRAAMGAPYVTRACMGPLGVLANHPGRSATLSRRPVPPTREYHPRPLKPSRAPPPSDLGNIQCGKATVLSQLAL